jgi:hypothetical protein
MYTDSYNTQTQSQKKPNQGENDIHTIHSYTPKKKKIKNKNQCKTTPMFAAKRHAMISWGQKIAHQL